MSFYPGSTQILTSLPPTCHYFRRILVIFVNISASTSSLWKVHVVPWVTRCVIIRISIWNTKTTESLYFSLCRHRKSRRKIFCRLFRVVSMLQTIFTWNLSKGINYNNTKTFFWFLTSSSSPIIADIMLSPRSVQTQPTTLSLGTGNRWGFIPASSFIRLDKLQYNQRQHNSECSDNNVNPNLLSRFRRPNHKFRWASPNRCCLWKYFATFSLPIEGSE